MDYLNNLELDRSSGCRYLSNNPVCALIGAETNSINSQGSFNSENRYNTCFTVKIYGLKYLKKTYI